MTWIGSLVRWEDVSTVVDASAPSPAKRRQRWTETNDALLIISMTVGKRNFGDAAASIWSITDQPTKGDDCRRCWRKGTTPPPLIVFFALFSS